MSFAKQRSAHSDLLASHGLAPAEAETEESPTEADSDAVQSESYVSIADKLAAFGINYPALPTKKKQEAAKQEAFLSAYARCGTVMGAARAAGVHHKATQWWRSHDDLSFRQRFDEAQMAFADHLEDLALERVTNPRKGIGSDTLLICLLNAHKPEKYRQNVSADDSRTSDVLSELRRIRRESGEGVGGRGSGKTDAQTEAEDDNIRRLRPGRGA